MHHFLLIISLIIIPGTENIHIRENTIAVKKAIHISDLLIREEEYCI